MGKYLEQVAALVSVCDADECEWIEKMIATSADYVQMVTRHVRAVANTTGRTEEEYRASVRELDASRSHIHNGLIDTVNIVNRLCASHQLPPIYTGDGQRRHYGDFAIELVSEVFASR